MLVNKFCRFKGGFPLLLFFFSLSGVTHLRKNSSGVIFPELLKASQVTLIVRALRLPIQSPDTGSVQIMW